MAEDSFIFTADYARKDTVGVLEGVAIILPEWKVLRSDGKVDDVGIPVPVSTPTAAAGSGGAAGTVPDGDYIYKVTYETDEGFYGTGSATFSVTVSDQEIDIDLSTLTNFRAHSAVSQVVIWRSLNGGTILYRVAAVAVGTQSYTDDNSDASISVNNTLQVAEQSFKVPAKDTYGFVFRAKNHLIAAGPADYWDDSSIYRNKVAWSGIETQTGLPFPEGWPDENVGTVQNGGEPLRSGTMLGDICLLFEESEIWMWTWINNPDTETGNGNMEPVGAGRGTVAFKTVINVDGDVWSLDHQGIFNYKGGQSIAPVTEVIQREFDRINWEQAANFCGAYDDKRIIWFVSLDQEEENKYAFVLDRASLKTGKGIRWWLYHLPQGVRDCTSYIAGNSSGNAQHGIAGKRVIQILTTQGHEQYMVEGVYLDSVHPDITQAGDIDSASDQVFTYAAGTFSSGNANAAGAMVQFDHPSTPDPLVIASATSTTFTLKDALAANLPAGTTFTIGTIKGYWRSGQLDVGGPEKPKDFAAVAVVTNPMPLEGEIRIVTRAGRLGEFAAGKNETSRTGYELEVYKPGTILKTGGRLRGTGNRTGYAEVPVHGRDARYIQVEIQDESIYPWEVVGYYVQSLPYTKRTK